MEYLTINDKKLINVNIELNQLLSNYTVYYQNLRSFHWNILGQNFFDLHNKFEELYNDAKIKIDEVAERILTLRYHPVSKMSKYLKIADITEVSGMQSDREMVEEILNNHKILLKNMKSVLDTAEAAEDEGTVDLMGSYIAQLEKSSWMFDAWHKKTTDQLKTLKMNELA